MHTRGAAPDRSCRSPTSRRPRAATHRPEAGNAEVVAGGAVLRVLLVALLREAHVRVAAGVVALPDLLAVGQVVGREAPAGCELVTAEADEHLALGDERRRRDRLALVGMRVLDGPDFLAGRGVERDDEAIQRAKHQLAVGKGRPAVDGVAAGAR